MKQIFKYLIILLLATLTGQQTIQAQAPVMKWDFETVRNRSVIEELTNISDTIEGNFEWAEGVSGKGIRLDGFTTRIVRQSKDITKPGRAFTIEAWVALGEYPLNWCPVITTESDEVKGYRLMIGPYGQVSFETAISEQWISCTSADEAVPLRKWMHITGVYTAKKELALYINGGLVSSQVIKGALTFPSKASCILGMVAVPGRPSNTIRTWGTVEAYYGLDGIVDDINVFSTALTANQVKNNFMKVKSVVPDIKPRRLPAIEKNPGHFGAYYTKLKYYPGWDNLWPVDQDPDIVVCFDNNPTKFIFWRGTRYGPAWVSENENWMADQSLETWGNGKNDIEGCFEHMQDRHCRFSHVRIIENNEARAVVHWRYALVSSHDHTWMPDPKTGWECWVDEYYYIYPDGSAIRKVSWNKGTTGRAIQYQESLPLTQPGQQSKDVIWNDYVHIADYKYNKIAVSVDQGKKSASWTEKYTIQQFNFKSENKPYICFEPCNEMWVRWIDGGYNHFPVNQARSDGRWAKETDRPTHFMSSPCSDPVIHESGNRLFWMGLYGMNNMNMDELISFGRSWAYAPALSLSGNGTISKGYDKTQRCYQLENQNSKVSSVELTLMGSNDSPIINPAIVVKNWNSNGAKILVNGKENGKYKAGINHQLDGDELVLYIPLKSEVPVKITILP
ncbi:LamG domain-containing protein [Ginsengibacter hankyongi]|uniref:LamG domain-containing protein n=1 Tax=Ginsengibacter hankyongi TaxID=2607284 RepID=A0A5J5ICA8_9BACT|nr:LamG domain-containing protein [Ginsengibacter hankyongi]KAA9036115.1 LamG domain-containing protein [Ginsengibacter hankyongi]